MFNKQTIQKIKDVLIVIVIGGILSLLPFYFTTSASTDRNAQINDVQTEQIKLHEEKLQQSIVNDAIERTETRQIKETLKRIEKKLDRLIENQSQSIN